MPDCRCFICDRPGAVHLIGTVHACNQHMSPTSDPHEYQAAE